MEPDHQNTSTTTIEIAPCETEACSLCPPPSLTHRYEESRKQRVKTGPFEMAVVERLLVLAADCDYPSRERPLRGRRACYYGANRNAILLKWDYCGKLLKVR